MYKYMLINFIKKEATKKEAIKKAKKEEINYYIT